MNLKPTDQIFAPADHPEYLLAMPERQKWPHNQESFLLAASTMLDKLVAEATEGEIEDANNRLKDHLALEAQLGLPGKLLKDPWFPTRLFLNPMVEGSPLHEWKVGAEDVLNSPQMPLEEAKALLAEEDLSTFLDRLL